MDEALANEQIASTPAPMPGANLQVTDLGPETPTNPKFVREMRDAGKDPASSFDALAGGHQLVDTPSSPEAAGAIGALAVNTSATVPTAATPAAPAALRTAVVTAPDGRKARVSIPANATPEEVQAAIKTVTDHMTSTVSSPAANNFNTPLLPDEETAFTAWKQQYAPNDSGADYDLRGAFKAKLQPDPTTGHWPDTFKKPNHPTFSDQSQYATFAPEKAGRWEGETYMPPATTTTPTSTPGTTPAPLGGAPAKSFADQSIDDAGVSLNLAAGRDANAWQGRYGAALTKPIADALDDVTKAFTEVNPESTGNPLELSTWRDALDRSLKLLHPLGVIGEQAGNVIFEASKDAGAPPEISAALALAGSLAAGAETPGISPKTTGPRMPLQGTAATRAEAAAADVAAGQADAAAGAAATASDAAAQQADALAAQADTAAQTAAPSPGAAARVQSELTPGGAQPIPTGRDVTKALETQLGEIKTPVQGIYDNVLEKATSEHRSLDPSNYKAISEQLAAIRAELGPTLSGQPKQVFDDLERAINAGDRIDYKMLDAYKQQLDTLFHGRTPHGATPRERILYDLKWDVRDKMRSMVDGDDREWLQAADTLWRDEIIGKNNPTAIGNLVKLAKKDPNTFVERVFGAGTSDKQANYAKAIMDRLGDTPVATQLREATLARVIDKATDATTGHLDPAKLLGDIGKFNQTFKDAVVGPKADAFFKVLQGEQSAVGTTSAAAKTAERAAKTAERTAKGAESVAAKARGAATAANEAAKAPNRLAKLTALGLEIGLPAGAHAIGGPIAGSVVGGIMGTGRLAGLLIPRASLAKALADNPTANLLIRAVKTGANSPAVPTLISAIRNRDKSVNFLGSEE